MPSAAQILNIRHKREKKISRRPGWRTGLIASLAVSLVFALVCISLAFIVDDLTHDLPSPELLAALLDPENGELLQPSRIVDRNEELVLFTFENPASGTRRFLSASLPRENQPTSRNNPERFASTLVEATIAFLDPYFWEHSGFTLTGLYEGSHPTLAQRLVSSLLLWNEPPSLRRALRERLLAYQITERYGREQVLTWYLNSAYYGRMVYGAEAAARVYFGKSAADLTLSEAAVLASVAENPSINPHDAPQAVRERQQELIQMMLSRRQISEKEALQALSSTITFRPPLEYPEGHAPAFVHLVMDALAEIGLRERLERGGVRVVTTLDGDLQTQVACMAELQLARLTKAGNTRTEACEAGLLLPNLPPTGDWQNRKPGAEVALIDPTNGQVLSLYSSFDKGSGITPNFPDLRSHPAGTLWTPAIYLTAFARGLGPASLVWDIPSTRGADEAETHPSLDGEYHGPVRLRIALANDYLSPADQLIEQVGLENVLETVRELGLAEVETTVPDDRTELLKNGPNINRLQAARAFGIFANGGILGMTRGSSNHAPEIILSIQDYKDLPWPTGGAQGSELSAGRPVLSPQLAYLITNILSDENARQPSSGVSNPLDIGRPAAVKIGRVPGGEAAWAVGYIPQLVVSVWMGEIIEDSQSSSEVRNLDAENAAAGLWSALLRYAGQEWPAQDWTAPDGITRMEVCDPSGLLPGSDCPNIVPEVFLAGNEPTHFDSLFRGLKINQETGRLATVYTPLELIEEKVFLLAPPDAQPWVLEAGLPLPPEEYDVIPASPPASPDARITSPSIFAVVRGEVPITGIAGGEDFNYYRLQYGKGLNPSQWQRIGGEVRTSVNGGRLGLWDTEGLDGLYALELLVVKDDQSVSSTVVQVTVDNQPPEIAVLYPEDGQIITISDERYITIQVQGNDNLELKSVEFFIDDESIASLVQAPYAIPWKILPGAYKLRVVATDTAGNQSEAVLDFTIRR